MVFSTVKWWRHQQHDTKRQGFPLRGNTEGGQSQRRGGFGYSLVAQVLEKVSEDFEGLHSNAFTLGGHELVDYPGTDTSGESWQRHTCLDRIKHCPVDEWALHWLADSHFPSGGIYISIK